jgi:hypothetical protein
MSKFLLNLLVQISKALVYSKIKFYSEKNFSVTFGPSGLSAQPRPIFFLFNRPFFSPLPTGPRPLGRPSPPSQPNWPPSFSSCIGTKRARCCRPASHRPHGQPRRLHRKKKRPHQSPFIPPLISAISPSSITGNRRLQQGPLKLLQRQPLKALSLSRLASAL